MRLPFLRYPKPASGLLCDAHMCINCARCLYPRVFIFSASLCYVSLDKYHSESNRITSNATVVQLSVANIFIYFFYTVCSTVCAGKTRRTNYKTTLDKTLISTPGLADRRVCDNNQYKYFY